jgi:hypothetical protein
MDHFLAWVPVNYSYLKTRTRTRQTNHNDDHVHAPNVATKPHNGSLTFTPHGDRDETLLEPDAMDSHSAEAKSTADEISIPEHAQAR